MVRMYGQFFSAAQAVPAAWLAAGHQAGSVPVVSRIVLVTVTVLAVGAFAMLQGKARPDRRRPPSERRRGRRPSDWRTLPRPYWPEDRDDEAPPGHEERYRPDWRYGYPPGYEPYPLYDPARSPWAVRDDAARDQRSLVIPGYNRAGRPAAFLSSTLRV
jgi:hypothetical protein